MIYDWRCRAEWKARRRGEAFAHDTQLISGASKFSYPINLISWANASPLLIVLGPQLSNQRA